MKSNSKSLTEKVYKFVSQVPKGKVTTYGHIGKAIGSKSYRAIGQILHRNPDTIKVPCHRVVFHDGSVSPNYGAGGAERQRERLRAEGITFIHEKVDLQKYLLELLPKPKTFGHSGK